MNPRTTGLLLLVALALGAFVWFYEIQGEAGRKQAAAQEQRLFPGLEAADVDAIELRTRDGEPVRLERAGDGFRLVEPLAFPADSFAVDGIASNLAGLEREALIEDPQPLAEYGLGEGARAVRFTVGEQTHELRLGNDTPVGPNVYANVEGRPEVVTVPRFAAQTFDKSLSDLRERRILDFDTASIRRLELAWPGERVVLERADAAAAREAGEGAEEDAREAEAEAEAEAAGSAAPGGVWRLVEPVEAPADDATVEGLLSDLSFLRAEGFVDDPPGPAAAGLEPPAFAATLSGPPPAEGAEATQVRLEIGGLYEGDQRLVRAAERSLYTIPAERLEELPRQVGTYRHRRLARFSAAEAEQVDLFFQPPAGDPVAVTAVRQDGSWTSTPERLAPEKIDQLVAELSDLQGEDVLADAPDAEQLESLGLSPPKVVVTVFGRIDEARPTAGEPEAGETATAPALPRLAEIQIGRVEGSEWIVARAAGSDTVYRLPYEMAEVLPVSLEALRNRFIAEANEAPIAPAAGPAAGGPPEFLTPSQESP